MDDGDDDCGADYGVDALLELAEMEEDQQASGRGLGARLAQRSRHPPAPALRSTLFTSAPAAARQTAGTAARRARSSLDSAPAPPLSSLLKQRVGSQHLPAPPPAAPAAAAAAVPAKAAAAAPVESILDLLGGSDSEDALSDAGLVAEAESFAAQTMAAMEEGGDGAEEDAHSDEDDIVDPDEQELIEAERKMRELQALMEKKRARLREKEAEKKRKRLRMDAQDSCSAGGAPPKTPAAPARTTPADAPAARSGDAAASSSSTPNGPGLRPSVAARAAAGTAASATPRAPPRPSPLLEQAQVVPRRRKGATADATEDSAKAQATNARAESGAERFSGIHVVKRLVSSIDMEERMEGKRMIKIRDVANKLRKYKGEIPETWVTIGVVTEKCNRQTKTGGQFAIWTLSDLEESEIQLYVFGDAFKKHWKESEGRLVALLAPDAVDKDELSGKRVKVKINDPNELMVVGTAACYGVCKGTRKDGNKCTMPVNTKLGPFCSYHVAGNYSKMLNKRPELNNNGGNYNKRTKTASSSSAAMERLKKDMVPKSIGMSGGSTKKKEVPTKVVTPAEMVEMSVNAQASKRSSGMLLAQARMQQERKRRERIGDKKASARSSRGTPASASATVSSAPASSRSIKHHSSSSSSSTGAATSERMRGDNDSDVDERAGSSSVSGAADKAAPKLGRGLSGRGSILLDAAAGGKVVSKNQAVLELLTSGGGGALAKKRDPNRLPEPSEVLSDASKREEALNTHVTRKPDHSTAQAAASAASGGIHASAITTARAASSAKAAHSSRSGSKSASATSESASTLAAVFKDSTPLDLESAKGKKILEKRSRFASVVEETEMSEALERMGQDEVLEQMEEKMRNMHEKKIDCFKCLTCDALFRRKREVCVRDGHNIKSTKATQRHWRCGNCGKHETTLGVSRNLLTCRCGKCDWRKTGTLKKETLFEKNPTVHLSLRGDERSHVKSINWAPKSK